MTWNCNVDCRCRVCWLIPKADSLDHVLLALEDLELLRLNSADSVVETETLETVPCDKPFKIGWFWHEPLKRWFRHQKSNLLYAAKRQFVYLDVKENKLHGLPSPKKSNSRFKLMEVNILQVAHKRTSSFVGWDVAEMTRKLVRSLRKLAFGHGYWARKPIFGSFEGEHPFGKCWLYHTCSACRLC